MTRGKGKKGRGGGGRGGGVDRGRDRGRGEGRGRGRGRGIQGSYLLDEALDFNIQMYADANLENPFYGNGRGHARKASDPNSRTNTPNRGRGRGSRGRGRGHPEMYSPSRRSDYGIGVSPKDRGRGGGTQKLRQDAPLTRLLYQERPLLRPIVFVPSVYNPILFDQDEALLKPGVEEVGDTEQSYAPTAARVSRVFSGGSIQVMESSSEAEDNNTNDDEEEEELEVVDFNDVAKLFEPTKKSKKTPPRKSNVEVVEKRPIGGFADNNFVPSSASSLRHGLNDMDTLTKMIDENLSATERSMEDDVAPNTADVVEPNPFYIDTQPTPIPAGIAPPSNPFPSDDFDDDIIVYVAPHARKGAQTSPDTKPPTNGVPDTSQFTPYVRDASLSLAVASSSSTATTIQQQPTLPQPQIPSMSSFSFSFATPEGKLGGRLRIPAVTTPRLAKSWKRKRGLLSQKGGKSKNSFRSFGAMREEAQLHDPKKKERRRGDSDLEWGDTDDDDDSGSEHGHVADRVESSSGFIGNGKVNGRDKGKGKARDMENEHGMEVDSDLDVSVMQHFVEGLLGENAGRHLTMDDLMDEEQMKLENEKDTGEDSTSLNESGSDGSSEDENLEMERAFEDEEAMQISEALEFESQIEDGEEDEEEDDGSEDDDQTPRTSFQKRLERLRKQASSSKDDDTYELSDDHDDYADMLERNIIFAERLHNRPRPIFNDLSDTDGESERFHPKKSNKDKLAELPEDLKSQWEKDRLKKAAYKKARAQARLEAAADPLSRKKGGKKGLKAMLAAARLDPTINVIPNRIIDMVTLVQQIRRFINDADGPLSMSLPPTNKATRKNIHEIAAVFHLKSISKGKGDSRYTTLTKTSKLDRVIDELKLTKIMKRTMGKGAWGDSFVQDKKKGKARTGARVLVARQREGEEVGGAAPKLSSSNLGFRMLAMMGWSEGERIGATGGLQDPLTAIIKNTKLGLGAAK